MNKDVIYIDVEDDITAIIGKVKNAKEKIVALVPPKRIGVLQSAVNLQLLSRAAGQNGKRLVLISNNGALMALASAAKIPVAKNLQSKPEMPEISALKVDNEDDIIDGAQLPVGELAKTTPVAAIAKDPRDDSVDEIAKAIPPTAGEPLAKPKPKSGSKVPNFDKFRKKLILIIGGAVLLVGFLVWAIFFAPRATVLITARTTDASANSSVTLGPDVATKLSTATLKMTTKTVEKNLDSSFDATGKKEVGDKAEGRVMFENCEDDSSITVPSGTSITANGRQYVTQASVTVPGGSGNFGGCTSPGQSSAVTVIAEDIGQEYNTSEGTTFSVPGHSSTSTSYFRAVATTDVDGGSKKEVKVVTNTDIQRAIEQVNKDNNTDEIKKQLASQFEDDSTVIDATFETDRSQIKPEPGIDGEATDGKAKLTGKIIYKLSAVSKGEASRYLDEYFKKQLGDQNDQRVYDNGSSDLSFTNVTKQDRGYSATLTASAKIGPKIVDEEIKEVAKGKRYGEIQSSIEAVDGIEAVDVKFWPFWVSQAPNDTKKISIEFKLNDTKE